MYMKIYPDSPELESSLVQKLRIGKSIHHVMVLLCITHISLISHFGTYAISTNLDHDVVFFSEAFDQGLDYTVCSQEFP